MKVHIVSIFIVSLLWSVVVADSGKMDTKQPQQSFRTNEGSFYTYQEIGSQLMALVHTYPSIATIDTIGFSLLGNPLWMLRIAETNNPTAKQRFFLNGAIHGNEKIGTEIIMAIATHLLSNYETCDSIKNIVGRSEMLLVPILNPDGYKTHRRSLESRDDPNRSFGWQLAYKGSPSICKPFQSPEMRSIRTLMMASPWYASFDYHAGIVGILTPWMCSAKSLPDSNEYRRLTNIYSQNSNCPALKSNGTQGESIDYPYAKYGTLAFLPEIHESQSSLPPKDMNRIVSKHLHSFLHLVNDMQKGIKGTIRNSQTGDPIFARVQVLQQGVAVYSDSRSGAFFKYIAASKGSYEISVFANGFKPKTVSVEGTEKDFVIADITLDPNVHSSYGAISLDAIRTSNDLSYSEVSSCLKKRDMEGVDLQCFGIEKSFLTLDMGPKTLITNGKGDDFTVYSLNNDPYTVSVSSSIDDLHTPDKIVGRGRSTTSFDIENCHLDSARFILISCTSGQPCIDAVEARPKEDLVQEIIAHSSDTGRIDTTFYTRADTLIAETQSNQELWLRNSYSVKKAGSFHSTQHKKSSDSFSY